MYGGYIESDFVKQNCRLWQAIYIRTSSEGLS